MNSVLAVQLSPVTCNSTSTTKAIPMTPPSRACMQLNYFMNLLPQHPFYWPSSLQWPQTSSSPACKQMRYVAAHRVTDSRKFLICPGTKRLLSMPVPFPSVPSGLDPWGLTEIFSVWIDRPCLSQGAPNVDSSEDMHPESWHSLPTLCRNLPMGTLRGCQMLPPGSVKN